MRRLTRDVAPDEDLSTFVFRKDHIVKRSNSVHYTRLMPRRRNKLDNGRLEVSVCRSTFLGRADVWQICTEYFDKSAPKPAIGRGVAKACVVTAPEIGLAFEADGMPYAEHANIIGWRDEAGTPDNELKNAWMDKAQKMAPKFLYESRV